MQSCFVRTRIVARRKKEQDPENMLQLNRKKYENRNEGNKKAEQQSLITCVFFLVFREKTKEANDILYIYKNNIYKNIRK